MDGIYDSRNKLNDLTGKEWLKLTKSFLLSEKCKDDKDAFLHPAPFLIKDVEKFVSLFTKQGMTVLDPFIGSGTTALACNNLNRFCVGIDLNKEYYDLAVKRFEKKGMQQGKDYQFIIGDSLEEVKKIQEVDFIITSPPYHNILKNNSKGIRKDTKLKGFRNGSRIGVDYYSENPKDLGNQESYGEFLGLLSLVMKECYIKLKPKKYCSLILSDFTVEKKEICVQADIVDLMEDIGFIFVGTIVLLQDNKPLYPFGYPYSFKINHMHQNIINFQKLE